MKPLVKFELIVAPASFALIFVSGIAGHGAVLAGVDSKTAERFVYAFILFFFCCFGFSLIGLMLHAFTALQIGMGNGRSSFIQFLAQHETGITFAVWGFLGVGTLIAAPFALYEAGWRLPLRSRGALIADIGMTMSEVQQRSTIPWREPTHMGDGSYMIVEDMTFDYQIGNSSVRFPLSRYFWLRTNAKDARLADINIGVNPEKLPLPEIEAFERAAHLQLHNNGWMPGQYVAYSEETIHMWGGKRTTGDGRFWLKNDTVISFERKRMDDEVRDEPPGSCLFIVDLHFWPKSEHTEVVFEPSAWRPGL
jgi:hypothetical protein